MTKALIFDSSTLISLSMNGLLEYLEKLKEIFDGKFIITKEVKQEIIDKPLTIKRFELEALRVRNLFFEKVIEMPDCLGIKDSEISSKTKEIMDIANNTFAERNRNIHLISDGEASCMALSKILNQKKIQNVICVDERTIRMLSEKPENLRKLMEKKLHTRINSKTGNYDFFNGFKFIRSTELIYVAYKKKLIDIKNGILLDALLYALKFKGCAISDTEIEEIKKLG